MTANDIASKVLDVDAPGVLDVDGLTDWVDVEDVALILRARGYHVCVCGPAEGDSDVEGVLISQLDIGFLFPDYFGQNWDAVDECVNDLSWIEASGYCCVLANRSLLEAKNSRVSELFASVMADAAENWRRRNKRFCLVRSRSR